jgi:hypothetical protein
MRIQKSKSAEVKASTESVSQYSDAIKYIRAAIDCLGRSDKSDVVAKDNIANLATIMFDLKGSEKS